MNDAVGQIMEENPQLGEWLQQIDAGDLPAPTQAHAGRRVINAQGEEVHVDGVAPRDTAAAAEGEAQAAAQATAEGEAEAVTAASNAADEQPTGPVNHEGLTAALQREVALQRGGSQPDPYRQLEGTVFNQNYMDSDVSAREVIEMAAEDIRAFGVRESTTFEAMTAGARNFLERELEIAPGDLDANLARMAQDAHHQQAIVVAGKELVQSLAREIEQLAYRVDSPNASEADMTRFLQYQARLVETSANLRSVITGAAQTTAAGRIRTVDGITGQQLADADILRQMQANIDSAGGPDAIRALARAVRANGGSAGRILRLAETSRHGPMGWLNEIRINGLLSGPKTHIVNMLSNAGNMLLLPSERVLGGLVSGDLRTAREGIRMFAGMSNAMRESFRAFRTSLREGRNILDPEAAILEANGIVNHAIAINTGNPVLDNIVNGMGAVIRAPSRLLMASDELFKQMNYRAEVYARLTTEAGDLVASGKLPRDRAARYVADRMEKAFDRHGSATSQAGLDHAREATFTQELRKGSLSRDIQMATNRHPGLKLLMPFVRTPTNIIVAGVQRTPGVQFLSKNFMDDIRSGDPRRRASAIGKMSTGAMIWGAAGMAAMEGKITGSGPSDPAARARLLETGWRPYSVVTENPDGSRTYTEYRRLAPFSMFFGLAADIAAISGQVDDQTMGDIALAATVALANNVASQTYLQGITDAVEAFSDPERYAGRYFANLSASMLPYSALMREGRKQDDPVMREVRSIVDAVMNTVPGYSENLPARRSWVTGQPIVYPAGWGSDMANPIGAAFMSMGNPFMQGDWEPDTVLDELAGLGYNFSSPTRTVEGVELTGHQYERLLELHGTVRIGRRTMYQALEHLMGTQGYDIGRERFADTDEPTDNRRIVAVQRVIAGYRRAAREALIRENAELRQSITEARRESMAARRGAYSGVAAIADQQPQEGTSVFDSLSTLSQ
jgi:polyhydroxyalkanoate synthesis regulator phasin